MASFIALLAVAGTVWCAPFVPDDNREVLETLPVDPRDPASRELRALRTRLALMPNDVPLAVEVAERYVELGRATGDPRYAGYAQAALAPWWDSANPPREVLLLRAALRQRVHAFDAALEDLRIALARNPRDAQARLSRATILLVRGDAQRARRDCQALRGIVHEVVWAGCLYGVESMRGELVDSYKAMRAAVDRGPSPLPSHVSAWLVGGLAEMAVRAGWPREAEAHFEKALRFARADPYLLAAYADFLLDRRRPQEVRSLLQAHLRTDALLLRYALALNALGSPEVDRHIEDLRTRFHESGLRGDRVHLREEARFALHLLREPRTALSLAKQNWSMQKEPADATILVHAAIAGDDRSVLNDMRTWMANSGFEDVQLKRLLGRVHPPR